MPSQTVIDLKADLALVNGQIRALLHQQVLLNHGVDGQSFQEVSSLKEMYALKKIILDTLRASQPYEEKTRTLITY